MIALTATVLLAAFILGPYLLFRLILSVVVPRRVTNQTQSEELTQAVIFSSVITYAAYCWAARDYPFSHLWSWQKAIIGFSELYNEQYFRDNQIAWADGVRATVQVGITILWRSYAITTTVAAAFITLLLNLSWILTELPPFVGRFCAALLLPRVTYWHIVLSKIVLPKGTSLQLDVLTKMDILYQGRFRDKNLGPDGSLVSLSLTQPRRFDRVSYLAAQQQGSAAKKADFWKPIPTDAFEIMASEIHSINRRYIPQKLSSSRRTLKSDNLRKALQALAKEIRDLDVDAEPNETE